MFTRPWLIRPGANGVLYLFLFCSFPALGAQQPDFQAIIQKSVAVTEEDFRLASLFNHKERDQTRDSSKTYQVTIIEGMPYQRLLAVNDSQQRRERIVRYEKECQRDHAIIEQLMRAFNSHSWGNIKFEDLRSMYCAPHLGLGISHWI